MEKAGIKLICGIDIGRSAVKVTVCKINPTTDRPISGVKSFVIPSCVRDAVLIHDGDVAQKTRNYRVEFTDKQGQLQKMFYGDGVLTARGLDVEQIGTHDDWIDTKYYDALLLGAFNEVCKLYEGEEIVHVSVGLGLPNSVFVKEKDNAEKRARELLGQFKQNTEFACRVVPQGSAPFYERFFDFSGLSNNTTKIDDMSYVVVEIGQYTTDISVFYRGHVDESRSFSYDGVYSMATDVEKLLVEHGFTWRHTQFNKFIQSNGIIKKSSKDIDLTDERNVICDHFANMVFDKFENRCRQILDDIMGVIVVGGGAPIVEKVFKAKAPDGLEIMTSEKPRFAVSEGLYKIALRMYIKNSK